MNFKVTFGPAVWALDGASWTAEPKVASEIGVLTVRVDDGRAAARLALLELFGRGHRSPGYSRWSAATLTVHGNGPMPAGLDGEPATLEPRLRFVTRPGALVVRLPLAPRSSARPLVEESGHLVRAAMGRGLRDRAAAAAA